VDVEPEALYQLTHAQCRESFQPHLPTKKPRHAAGQGFRGILQAQWSASGSRLRDSPRREAIDGANSTAASAEAGDQAANLSSVLRS
jgi:hypothetical protein